MNTKDKDALFQFPCSYPLKVMGRNTGDFCSAVEGIVKRHVPAGDEIVWSSRASSGQKYLSMTATLLIHSEEQLNALYQELNDHELVLVTL